MRLFLFGTLLHAPLMRVVSGMDGDYDLEWAARDGFRVAAVVGQAFPMMSAMPGRVAEGVLVSGLTDEAQARLDYYEKAFGYVRDTTQVRTLNGDLEEALVYLPQPDRWQPDELDWDLEEWGRKWGDVGVEAAKDAMVAFGSLDALEMGKRYPQTLSRAAARVRAGKAARRGNLTREDVTLFEQRRPYEKFFAVEELDISYRRFNGEMTRKIERAIFVGGDSAIVLPYDPVRDRVLLIEQFRAGAYGRGDPNPWTVEPIAGRIDAGEEPEDAARREAEEEAGVILRQLECVSASYPSPGTTTEHFYVFVGMTDLPDDVVGIGGEEAEDEDIRSHLMSWEGFDAALNHGEFKLLPLVVAGHWLARNRERLRALS